MSMQTSKQFNRGFTIIELLVVVVIIAVITALTMAIYSGIQSKVIDLSVTSDLDRLNSLEMNYKSNHGSAGKAYYSGDGPDSELGNFVPKSGNIFDVVVNATDYCIRGYNVHGTKDSIYNASLKESTVGVCGAIPPSATAAATPSLPDAPVVTVTMVGGSIQANITPVACSVGTARYSVRSRINDGSWEGYSEWSESTTATRTADDGTKYGYQAQSQCYISYIPVASAPSQGVEGTYSNLLAPTKPSVSVALNGGNVDATVTPITCSSGTIQYGFSSRINGGAWSEYSAWASTTTASIASTGGEGVKYGFTAQARCYINVNAVSTSAVSDEGDWTSPINAPAAPVVSVSTTAGYVSTYSWPAVTCAVGTTARYQYKLNVSPSGYDSGWAATAGLSAVFTTSTGDETYTVQTQGQCYNANANSSWGVSGSENYFCIYNSVPIATSISGSWATAPTDYLLEDGSAISRTTYSDLFAVIGTTYGAGDGSTTFNLPDSRGRVAVNKNPTDTEFATIGQKYGEKMHILSVAETPLHTHIQNAHNHTQDAHSHSAPTTNGVAGSSYETPTSSSTGYDFGPVMLVTSTVATNQAATATNQNTGSDAAHNTIQPSIVKLFVIKYTPVAGSLDNLTKGTSISGYWSSAPSGYLMEDGTTISRTAYADLFAVIGTTYGAGDGSTTFNLPDSRGRVAVNKNPTDTEFATIGQKYGEKMHILSVAETPLHTHIQNAHNHTQDAHSHSAPTTNGVAGSSYETPTSSSTGYDFGPVMPVTSTVATNQAATATNQNTGGGGSHNNIQPSIVQNFAIKY